MHYFITSDENPTPSAIEIAQMQRVQLFKSLNIPCHIIETDYNVWHDDAQKALKSHGYVINLFQYYQKLDYKDGSDLDLIDTLLHKNGYDADGLFGYQNGKKRIQLVMRGQRLFSANYYDQYGFYDRADYYDDGVLAYSDFFEDQGRKVLSQYYDNDGVPVICLHYRGGENNVPALSLIQLYENGQWLDFDTIDGLRAHFFDEIVKDDPNAVLYADRSDYTFNAFKLMKTRPRRYMIFHSALTTNGELDGPLFEIYKDIGDMLQQGILTGLISSTQKEAEDAKKLFNTNHSYAIPVTYAKSGIVRSSFNKRTSYSLIAVARQDSVKQLDHIIKAVYVLRQKYPALTLTIYGYGDSTETPKLAKLVKDLKAEDYIKFGGYKHDLTAVYDHAWIEVLTSKFEGFAMALLEAQEHGVCCVSYDINYGPSEIIQDGVTGWLVKKNDQQGLIKILDMLLDSPDMIKGYSVNAYANRYKYSFANVAEKWQAFLINEKLA